MNVTQLPPYIQHLLKPESYPHPVPEVRLVQTHISYVLLAGNFVYKFKKPLDFGFLDFTTLEKRKHFCEQELLLNRRLCPDMYLSLVRVTMNGGLSLDGIGSPVEYGVKMKRLPEEKMMVNIIRAGKLTHEMIDGIVRELVPFYEAADDSEPRHGTPESVGLKVLGNLDQTRNFVGEAFSREQFDRIYAYSERFLSKAEVFMERIRRKCIRECHGDMYSANICLADRIYIYDCIEFNRRFRYCDVASDIAFLAMDLDYHGLREISSYFVDLFAQSSGDEGIADVLDFYKCYRASVRGKIGLLTAHETEVDDATREKAAEQARRYFSLALSYAAAG